MLFKLINFLSLFILIDASLTNKLQVSLESAKTESKATENINSRER